MAGRIGLISTAVSTKDTGYMNHRLIKMLEELKIAQDGSVRYFQDLTVDDAAGARFTESAVPDSVRSQRTRPLTLQVLFLENNVDRQGMEPTGWTASVSSGRPFRT